MSACRYLIERWEHRDGAPGWDFIAVVGPIEGEAAARAELERQPLGPTDGLRLIAIEFGQLATVAARMGRAFGRRLPECFGRDTNALVAAAAGTCVRCGGTERLGDDIPCGCGEAAP